MMTPQEALIHAMQALDWENVPEDAEAVRVLRALNDWLVANAEDMSLDVDTEPTTSLPRDKDGEMITDASFGQLTLVEIVYNTDADGEWVPFEDHTNRTYHGPFTDLAEAQAWMENHRPDDTEIKDMETIVVNAVRPAADPNEEARARVARKIEAGREARVESARQERVWHDNII